MMDGMVNILSGIGTTADKRSGQHYNFCKLPWHAIEARYRSSWLARKIIDLPASEMTRPKRLWQAESTDITALEDLERRLGVWAKLEEALRLGRMGGGLMVIGSMQGDVSQPLPPTIRPNSLAYLHVMCRDDVVLGDINRDPGSPDFGKPAYFEIVGETAMVRLHPSRVIPFKGRYVPRRNANDVEAFWGDSELDAIDEAIRNADTAQNGLASLIEEAKVDIWGIPDLTNAFLTADTEAALIRRFTVSNMMKSMHNAVIKDGDDSWETRELNLANVPDVIMAYIELVAGAASMPATVLLGKSPDGMNATGDGDLQNWERTLDGWRESQLRPALDILDPMLKGSAGLGNASDVWWDFGPLRERAPSEIIEEETKRAAMVKTAIDSGAPSEPLLKALANAFVEAAVLPGLDEDMAEYEKQLAEEPEVSEQELAAMATAAPQQIAANDATPRPLYVSRKLKNVAELQAWATAQGIGKLQDDLHVTIAYSTAPVDWIKMGQDYRDFNHNGKGEMQIAEGGPRVVEPLGDRTAVLMFASSDLSWRNREMREEGASWDYPDYQPHISLTGEPVDLSGVEPYRGKLVLGPEIFEDLDLDR